MIMYSKKKSHWIIDENGDIRCAACQEELPYVIISRVTWDAPYPRKDYINPTYFCPHCGAEMEVVDE